MVKMLLLGLLLSGSLTLESGLVSTNLGGALAPDMALLALLTYAALGQGRVLFPFCFLCGWIKGVGCSEPAGFYILVYLLIGHFLFKTRNLFFMERPMTQIVLSLFCGLLYWLFQGACRGVGLLPALPRELLIHQLYGCVSAALFAPFVFSLYRRLNALRKLLHP